MTDWSNVHVAGRHDPVRVEPPSTALFYVDGLSTAECMHALLAAAEEAGLCLGGGDDVTPADIAVQTWLLAPELVERTHAEQYLTNPKSFENFKTQIEPEPTRFRMPTSEVLQLS